MGLFNKAGKGESTEKKEKPVKQKAGKKNKPKKGGLFGGKKKDRTLIEIMQLEESVAAASIDVVQELADLGESAVRETSEGLLIIAITNDILESAELDPTSADFGSFAEALRSETIESIALAHDLEDGVIGIIPSAETLVSLDEFDFAHEIEYRWALVPFDLEDEDRLVLLEGGVHIGELVEMAEDEAISARVENGTIKLSGGSSDMFSDDDESEGVVDNDDDTGFDVEDDDQDYDGSTGVEDDDQDEDPDWDAEPETTETPVDVNDGFDYDDDLDDDDAPAVSESDEYASVDLDDLDDDDDLGLGDDDDDTDDNDELPEESLSAEESKELINRVATHSFNNTELGLEIDMKLFDDLFDSLDIAQFDTSYQDDSELQRVISKLRQDANTELKRLRQDNIHRIRARYASSISDIHNRLVDALDHKNPKTSYGARTIEIENAYDEGMGDLDRRIANKVQSIRSDYEEDRQEYGENAKREALSVYDLKHRDKRDVEISNVDDTIQTDLKLIRDTDIGRVFTDRREVASRLFDKATTTLLNKIQIDLREASQKELRMFDAFRKDMDVYLRKHFADDVLRSKAEAETLRQRHEAERVRQEYEQMLTAKSRRTEEMEQESAAKLRELQANHDEAMQTAVKDFEKRLEREQRDNTELRDLVQEATRSSSTISEQKDKEIAHTLTMYKNQIEAKDIELSYANDRLKSSQRPMWLIMAAIGTVMIALGIIIGFLVGVGSSPDAPQQQAPTEQYGFADEIDYSLPVGAIDITGLLGSNVNTVNESTEGAAGAVFGATFAAFGDRFEGFDDGSTVVDQAS